jgi:hypothetical protein
MGLTANLGLATVLVSPLYWFADVLGFGMPMCCAAAIGFTTEWNRGGSSGTQRPCLEWPPWLRGKSFQEV